jgi:hypothetical protein
MTKDKAKKSSRRRRTPGNPDSVVFSRNRSALDGYVKRGTSVALSGELDAHFFKELLKKIAEEVNSTEGG